MNERNKKLIIKKVFFLFFFIIINNYYFLVNSTVINKSIKELEKKILIEVDTDLVKSEGYGGPISFIKSINQILPYNTSYCSFVPSEKISLINTRNKTDYFYIFYPIISENDFNKWIETKNINRLLLGPIFVPANWNKFPQINIWKERRFPEILKLVKRIIVHSERVKNYISQKSHTTSFLNKYLTVRACTNFKSKSIKEFNDRTIDILFFEKYCDLDRSKQGNELFDLLKSSNKTIVRIKYGSYDKEQMIEWANNSKFIIYFSFYDTGAIGLKEIQNHGVITFALQKEFINDKTTGFYIPELSKRNKMKYAYKKIMKKIERVTKEEPNTELIAKINYNNNKCEMALNDICEGLKYDNNNK